MVMLLVVIRMSKKFHERVAKSCGEQSKVFHSKFGAQILRKYGWEEGTGLGKERNGTLHCLQIRRREEKLGLGAVQKSSTDQWSNWWDKLYNQTAKKVKCGELPTKRSRSPILPSSSSSDESDTGNCGSRSSAVSCQATEKARLNQVPRKKLQR